ncbi:hypothetical protein R6Q59_006557 [Mikania micrantha]
MFCQIKNGETTDWLPVHQQQLGRAVNTLFILGWLRPQIYTQVSWMIDKSVQIEFNNGVPVSGSKSARKQRRNGGKSGGAAVVEWWPPAGGMDVCVTCVAEGQREMCVKMGDMRMLV